MKEYKLTFELVPEECWYSNLRSVLKPSDWDKVRFDAYARAKGKCMICGGWTKRLEAHEKWSYDEENALQKLEDVVALCHRCHEVKHISRTQLVGRGAEAMEHFMKVNGVSQMDYHAALQDANEEYLRRNKVEGWVTDISWLQGRFGIALR
ncbi:MAG: HNH endonuclease [Clostridia bacterium]|nr:HNH endonuclease [Clostridia bacterium]